jgi:hypothetical protein
MSKDTFNCTFILSKATIFNMLKNEIILLLPLTSLAHPCCPPLHQVHPMCGDFRLPQIFLGIYGESQGVTCIGCVAVEKGNLMMQGLDSPWRVLYMEKANGISPLVLVQCCV